MMTALLFFIVATSGTPDPAPRMVDTLGPAATSIVREPKHVEAGILRVIGAAKAEEQRFKTPKLIAGYPVKSALRELSPQEAQALAELLLDDRSYATGPVQRCGNTDFLGLRFSVDDARVEFALGRPCAQGILVHRTDGGIVTDGRRMTEAAATTIASIVAPTR